MRCHDLNNKRSVWLTSDHTKRDLEILEMYKVMPMADISKKYGISYQRVGQILLNFRKKFNINMDTLLHYRKHNPKNKNDASHRNMLIIADHAMSLSDLSKKYHLSKAQIGKILIKYGFPPRTEEKVERNLQIFVESQTMNHEQLSKKYMIAQSAINVILQRYRKKYSL